MTVKIKWNRSALRQIRYGDADPRVIVALEKHIAAVARRANAMARAHGNPDALYVTGSRPGKRKPQGRWRTSVVTANWQAMRDNQKHNTLTKALFGTTGESYTGE